MNEWILNTLRWCVLLGCGLAGLSGAPASEPEVSVDFQIYLWPGQSPFPAAKTTAAAGDETLTYRWANESDDPLEINDPEIFLEMFYWADGENDPVELLCYPRRLTNVYSYRGSPRLRFFQRGPDGSDLSPRLVAETVLSENVSRVVLFFFPMPDGGLRILPVEMDPGMFIGEHILLVNLSDRLLQCSLGGPAFPVKAGEKVLREGRRLDDFYQPILLASLNENGQLRRRLMRKMGVQEDELTVCLIYNPKGNPNQLQLLQVGLPLVVEE